MITAFQRCHPAVNLLFYIEVLILCMVFRHPVFLAVSLLAAASACLLTDGRKGLGRVCALLPLAAMVTLLNAGFAHYGVTPLYTLPGGNRITLEAIVFGGVLGGMIVAVLLWFHSYSRTVTEDRFFCVFGRLAPHLAQLLLLILRFLPLLERRMREAVQAQQALRGGATLRLRLRTAFTALSATVGYALEHAVDTADTMRARGFGLHGRRSYARFRFRLPDALLLGGMTLCFALALAGRLTGAAAAIYNPIIQIAAFSPFGVAALIAYALLCFTPHLLALGAHLRWQFRFERGVHA